MTLDEVMLTAHQAGIVLWAEGANLRYRAPKGALTPELRQALLSHKAALLSECNAGSWVIGDQCPACREEGKITHVYISREGFWWCRRFRHRRVGDEAAEAADLGAVLAWEAAEMLREAKQQQRAAKRTKRMSGEPNHAD